MRAVELLITSAEAGLRLQRTNGAMPAGINGPWNEPETPVRNTAHWALTFEKAFELSQDERFRLAAIACCDYLILTRNRPFGSAFYCRKKLNGKACSNGLIGQAWAIEPLLVLGTHHPEKNYWEVAETILSLHPYEWEKHGWSSIEITGAPLGFSNTLNQQIWFAVMAFHAGERNKVLKACARDFFGFLTNHLRYIEPGLVGHAIPYKSAVKRILSLLNSAKMKFDLRSLSIGYQSFILHGFSKLERRFPGELLRISAAKDHLNGMLSFVLKYGPGEYGPGNPFAWSYNPTGIEVACFLQSFSEQLGVDTQTHRAEDWLSAQISRHFDKSSGLMHRAASDPNVLAARIYETADLRDMTISLEKSTGS